MLRRWQLECSEAILQKFKAGHSHFFCQATPGAGKTVLAASIASSLLQDRMVDFVLCFSPSLTVSEGIKKTFSQTINRSFNGRLGAIGQVLTYQSVQFLNDELWQELRHYRVFVVFDEVHHCSGTGVENANVWGQQILSKVQGVATYILSMSGTPWRSDAMPIVMGEYSTPDGRLLIDYNYSLKQAVVDKVCRAPNVVLVDSEHLSVVTSDERVECFSSILEMILKSKTSYQSVIHNQEAMEYLLGLGCKKLAEIRFDSPFAGGLVVASSVQHAQTIKQILSQKYSQTVSIVTYRHEEPLLEIERYRQSDTQWIVSVGMISEGTDIPRLQVCCHMSSVKTELYFRQVLGRILRCNSAANQQAWLFTFAEQSLIEFAERIEQDIPESCMFVKMKGAESVELDNQCILFNGEERVTSGKNSNIELDLTPKVHSISELNSCFITPSEEVRLGSFKQRVISAFLAT
ncbi:DEAD/DEAH box helicase [Vibrio harveyi]|uniref:DEAD/DEAH box helicase n=1 Tax=Vibrio harveyi TaxID=669 RepID=UPI0004276F36|nr:DEAD/DEAH box helicase family protein [Vibrio harveyi]